MVGVPGKSKGCSTCRRRKKGCGQERPSCRQCLNSGHVCGGYERHLTFILHPASKDVEDAVFLPVRPAPPLLALLPSLDRTTMLLQCRNLFFGNFLPTGQCIVRDPDILKSRHPTSWVELIPGFPGGETSLELAFSALSIARLGRNNNDSRLVKESNKLYGKALRSLQKALYDSRRMCSEQVLAACQTLGLYETYEGAGGRSAGWISHAQGAARIIELRGPQAYSTHSAHFLLVGSRVPIIYSATVRRKGTFLAERDWLTLPWTSIRRTGMDLLVDITTRIPTLLEELDSVKSDRSSTKYQDSLLACLSKFQVAEKSLAVWLLYRKTNAVPISTKHELLSEDDIYPYTHHLVFENHLFAGSNLFHWSMNLVVSATILEILLLLVKSGYQAIDLTQSIAATQQDARLYATNIVQAVPYCLLPEMGDLGINTITFPMCLAFKFFLTVKENNVCAWLMKVCDEMQHMGLRPGYEEDIPQFNASFGSQTFLDMQVPEVHSVDYKSESDDNLQDTGSTSMLHRKLPLYLSRKLAARSAIAKQDKDDAVNTDATKGGALVPSAAFQVLLASHDEHDLESHGDADSPFDAMSPTSGTSHTSSNSSRGLSNTGALGIPKHLAHLQMINASKGEYTFVAEDPSNCYIVAEQRKT